MAKKVPFNKLGLYLKADVEAESELEYKAFAFTVFSEVIQKTPVDTGRARGNWNISSGTPNYSTSANTFAPVPYVDVREFPPVFISNGLDYIADLESGKSSQAPNGISAVALAAVRNKRR